MESIWAEDIATAQNLRKFVSDAMQGFVKSGELLSVKHEFVGMRERWTITYRKAGGGVNEVTFNTLDELRAFVLGCSAGLTGAAAQVEHASITLRLNSLVHRGVLNKASPATFPREAWGVSGPGIGCTSLESVAEALAFLAEYE